MDTISRLIEDFSVIVLDGALATELERRGADLHDPLWSAKVLLEEPESIRRLHLDYLRAGADCAITASYQASVEGFAKRGLGKPEALGLMRRSVELAKEARDELWSDPALRVGRPYPLVAASIGPYGAFLADGSEYRGDYGLTEAELVAFHRERMAALLEAGPDVLACETIPCRLEARALVRLLAEFPAARAWLSFTAGDGAHLRNGESFVECVAWLDRAPQVVAVGVNCTSPELVSALVRGARTVTDKPIVVYPNSGERYDVETGRWEGVRLCEDAGGLAGGWYAEGARLIGGCCRTTPEDIGAIASWARKLRSTGA